MRTALSPRAGYGRGEEHRETKGEDGGGGDFRRAKRLRMWRRGGEEGREEVSGVERAAAVTTDTCPLCVTFS